MGDPDLRVGRLAAGQHSLVTHSQLLGAGLTAPQIDHRVRRRALLLVHRGVYRMPGVRPTYESHVMAACLATGGLASHGCAARLFGFRGFHRWKPVEVASRDASTGGGLGKTVDAGTQPAVLPARWYRVDIPGGRVRLDTAWPDLLVNVEADGRLWHTSPSDRRRDAARDARLRAAGWTVVRVTWLQLTEEPQDVGDRIAHALGLARPLAAA